MTETPIHATNEPRLHSAPLAPFGKAAVAIAMVFAIGAPASQALTGWGLSPAQFSATGDATLRAASYAFSIWSLIYAGLIAYAVYQALPGPRWTARLAWPAGLAIAGCGLWILASASDSRWLTVATITISAAAALAASMIARAAPAGWGPKPLAVWPLAMLGGWLLVASAINVLTVMTAEGLLTPPATLAAALAVAAVVAVGVSALVAGVSPVYALPPAWGLVAVFVAERAEKPASAYLALAGAVVLLIAAGVTAVRRRR